ncbi:DUF3570 domain-containing protein [Maribrevibacterium harenarium]|uniref:DUF3570 domain-containing protein n=1 Tax=Maribrevibacterium harenarium TaxID=2589817 RepID=UPI001F33FD43|nr:DUF3570 domain-containing protein [Maribrevibacterium harenarium]
MAVTNSKRSPKDVAALLAAASCALTAQNASADWSFDVATLLYQESDGRVSAIEPVISAKQEIDSETSLSIKVVGDTLTGASPNGATPSTTAQTFTRPSGQAGYTSAANTTPLDPSFKDTRGALSVNWVAPIDRDWAYSLGGYGSVEHDYASFSGNGSLSRYFDQKNTTLTLATSLGLDIVSPEGGAPTGLSDISTTNNYSDDDDDDHGEDSDHDDDDHEGGEGDDGKTKLLVDGMVGITQILNRQTLMQFNYGLSYSSGYLTDPYKFLSVIDTTAGSNYGGNYQLNSSNLYVYEKRPDSRVKQSLYWQTKHQFDNRDIFNISYRYMWDDWGIQSHTVDTKYRLRFEHLYFEPGVRWYTQSAADFYRRYLTNTNYQSVSYATADYRLGELDTLTYSLRVGYKFASGNELYGKVSLYEQTSKGDNGFGKLTSQNLYPSMQAYMLTVGYYF